MYEGKREKNKDYSLGLHGAALNGNVGLVKFALDHGAPIDSVINGYMPLQLACINENHIAVVQYLIDRGADVNAQRWSKKHSTDKSQAVAGATGSTALHVACANGCTKIVDLLLRNGARTNVRDKYGSRPVDVAAARNHIEIVKLLETFDSMQLMLKGLQEGKNNVIELEREPSYRRSMDTTYRQQQKAAKMDRLRRPSLPSVFESQKLNIPDISTLPPPRHSLNTIRPTQDELGLLDQNDKHSQPIPVSFTYSSTKSSFDDSFTTSVSTTDNYKEDWYSYGVVNHYDDENYLLSLERRAFGLYSPPATSYFSHYTEHENESRGRASFDIHQRSPSLEMSSSLKRCSSDGGHLRTTALMNAMAANNNDPSEPRPSVYEGGRPSLDQIESLASNTKKSWWNHMMGGSPSNEVPTVDTVARKSIDIIYPVGRPSLDNNSGRKSTSLDFRPSLDSLSQFAKRNLFEGLTRRSSLETNNGNLMDDNKSSISNRSFLSKWWSNHSNSIKK
ncbi:uncharacterized protein BX663DRAFT_522792 [Cokeromyces recurvatus]|uniref:uncharacterized protein n=1 Tax=Cokeromyces recurvatus TaxID=90255 RepID=UPI00221F39DB|nr:uncharacterized protein BX663DRAFT_522792 [Cokeromyces recurvatus]KAI7898996.1 hypothetical protein BX663DRAFT_522792 [Cokeromyces recurvatus]